MRHFIIPMLLIPALSQASIDIDDYHAGVKVSKRNMGFQQEFGNQLFANSLTQATLFTGVDFNQYFSADLELFSTNNKEKSVSIADGATEVGIADFSGAGDDAYKTSTKLYGGGINLSAQYPISDNLKVFGTFGLSLTKLKLKGEKTINDGLAATPTEINETRISTSKTKILPKLGIGLDYLVTKNFGLKGDVSWEKTNSLRGSYMTIAGVNTVFSFKPNNSIVYGLSAYIKF